VVSTPTGRNQRPKPLVVSAKIQNHCKAWPRKVKLNCICCNGESKRRGFYRNKNFNVQRFECLKCGTSFSDKQPLDNLRVDFKQACTVLNMGNESPVKQIDNIHWVRVDINFLTNGAPISGGAIELVANNFHKFFSIPPQTDTNPPDGTIIGETHFPYLIFATNVGIMHKTEVKRRKMLKSCG